MACCPHPAPSSGRQNYLLQGPWLKAQCQHWSQEAGAAGGGGWAGVGMAGGGWGWGGAEPVNHAASIQQAAVEVIAALDRLAEGQQQR